MRTPELRRQRARRAGALLPLVGLLAAGCNGGLGLEGPFALVFDGAEDCVEVNMTSLEVPSAWTIETWIRGDAAESDRARPLLEWNGVFSLGEAVGGDTVFAVGATEGLTFTTSVVDGKLRHVAGTFDGTRATLYVDGVKQAFADGLPPSSATSTLRIGCSAGAEAYGGILDEVRLSSTLRYESDFDRPVAPFEEDDDTLLLFHFDEGEGEQSFDAVAGVTAELQGPEWITFDLENGE